MGGGKPVPPARIRCQSQTCAKHHSLLQRVVPSTAGCLAPLRRLKPDCDLGFLRRALAASQLNVSMKYLHCTRTALYKQTGTLSHFTCSLLKSELSVWDGWLSGASVSPSVIQMDQPQVRGLRKRGNETLLLPSGCVSPPPHNNIQIFPRVKSSILYTLNSVLCHLDWYLINNYYIASHLNDHRNQQ